MISHPGIFLSTILNGLYVIMKEYIMNRKSALRLLVLLFALAITACGGSPTVPQTDTNIQTPAINAEDFFPSAQGTEWTYKIEVREAEPLGYEELLWPQPGDQVLVIGSRRRFAAAMDGGKNFLLKMQVKGPAAQQGPLKYPHGVELLVVTDEMGIYRDVKQMFWAMRGPDQASGFAVERIIVYDANGPAAPTGGVGSMNIADGYAQQMMFFNERPGTSIGYGKDPTDTLAFVGIEANVAGFADTPVLHYQRTVKAAESSGANSGSILDSGFTEDMWFAKGKGLVLLEQKVDGKTSMIWTLNTSP